MFGSVSFCLELCTIAWFAPFRVSLCVCYSLNHSALLQFHFIFSYMTVVTLPHMYGFFVYIYSDSSLSLVISISICSFVVHCVGFTTSQCLSFVEVLSQINQSFNVFWCSLPLDYFVIELFVSGMTWNTNVIRCRLSPKWEKKTEFHQIALIWMQLSHITFSTIRRVL